MWGNSGRDRPTLERMYGRAAEALPAMEAGAGRADGVVWFGRLEEEEDKR